MGQRGRRAKAPSAPSRSGCFAAASRGLFPTGTRGDFRVAEDGFEAVVLVFAVVFAALFGPSWRTAARRAAMIARNSASGIFVSSGNERLPLGPAYGAMAFMKAASPTGGGYTPTCFLKAAK